MSVVRRSSRRPLPVLLALVLMWLLSAPLASAEVVGYHVSAGRIHDAEGHPIQLRGINHYGFNSEILVPQYLWQMGWRQQIAQIKALGFNALRVPYVPDTLHSTVTVERLSWLEPALNAELLGRTPLQVLDLWLAEADRQGLYLVLDFHSVSRRRQYPTWFVDDPADFELIHNHTEYREQDWIADLVRVAQRYAHLRHFVGIDLYNEPHGKVRWGGGDANASDPRYDWKRAAEKAAQAVLAANPRLLVFVQGINGNWDGVENSRIPMNFGEDLQPQAYLPLAIRADKLVFSPHSYGPDVYVKTSFDDAAFPANLPAHWQALFGFLHPRHALVPGEWGGRYGQGAGADPRDRRWQDAFVSYLSDRGIHSSFYWCYTPNSGDSGGLLDENLQLRTDKMELLRRHWQGDGGEPSRNESSAPPEQGAAQQDVGTRQ